MPTLQCAERPEVFAVGDVAATDPLRTSARNRADRLVADNIRAYLAGRPLGTFRPNRVRWGSVLGIQPNGIEVFLPTGRAVRIPLWPWSGCCCPGTSTAACTAGSGAPPPLTGRDTPFEQMFAWCLIRSNM